MTDNHQDAPITTPTSGEQYASNLPKRLDLLFHTIFVLTELHIAWAMVFGKKFVICIAHT